MRLLGLVLILLHHGIASCFAWSTGVRFKLKEVLRQKRAPKRLSKSSSAPDLARVSSSAPFAPSVKRKKSESGNRLAEIGYKFEFREQNTVSSLRKARKEDGIEKDAAVVAGPFPS